VVQVKDRTGIWAFEFARNLKLAHRFKETKNTVKFFCYEFMAGYPDISLRSSESCRLC
jgi:hypothetical protein